MSGNHLSLHDIKQMDQDYYFGVFGQRGPLVFERGEGSWLIDNQNNRYLDMLGGIAVNVLGHGNPALVSAISEQAAKLIHCSNLYYIENQAKLAKKLCSIAEMDKAFFCNSGAEANEAAIKLVRAYRNRSEDKRHVILTAKQSFHGRTLATATATGQEKYNLPFAPLPPGFDTLPFGDIFALKKKLEDGKVAALMLELVQGESGVHALEQAYVEEAALLCKKHDALLIIDEVQTGMGRTGYFTAARRYGIQADIITLAKGLGGGVPIAAMLARGDVCNGFLPGDHGSTFGGNPLATAAALAVINEIEKHDLMNEAKRKGELLANELNKIPGVRDVRGLGLMVAFGPVNQDAVTWKNSLMHAGILVGSVGLDTIRLLPPLTVSDSEIKHFVDAVKQVSHTFSS